MKKLLLISALLLAGCSTNTANTIITAANNYNAAVQNFNAAVAAINGSIALTSQTIGPYCQAAKAAGQNLTTLAGNNTKAVDALNSTAAALNTYCIALPTDIQTAIQALTAAAVAAKNAKG